MSRNYTSEFNDLIKNTLAKPLKKIGFKKSNLNFMCPQNGFAQTCNVQRSRFNHIDSINFTINIGMYIPIVSEILTNSSKISTFPKPDDCYIRVRTGHLIYSRDYWYELNESVSLDSLTPQLAKDVNDYLIPMFQQYVSIDSLLDLARIDYYERKYKLGVDIDAYAILELEYGDFKRGKSLLLSEYNQAIIPKIIESKRVYPDGHEEIITYEGVGKYRIECLKRIACRYKIKL